VPYYPTDEFKKLAEEIKASGKPQKVSVRKLISFFRQARRSWRVIWWIKDQLTKYGLECVPDFENVYIDSLIELRRLPTVPAKKVNSEAAAERASERDPVPRLSLLPAANRAPVAITRDAALDRAITTMMMHDFLATSGNARRPRCSWDHLVALDRNRPLRWLHLRNRARVHG
jgi:hypothetical protein